jgi:hypothetical protein
MIGLAQQYGVEQWIAPAVRRLALRPESLSMEDARVIGSELLVEVASYRDLRFNLTVELMNSEDRNVVVSQLEEKLDEIISQRQERYHSQSVSIAILNTSSSSDQELESSDTDRLDINDARDWTDVGSSSSTVDVEPSGSNKPMVQEPIVFHIPVGDDDSEDADLPIASISVAAEVLESTPAPALIPDAVPETNADSRLPLSNPEPHIDRTPVPQVVTTPHLAPSLVPAAAPVPGPASTSTPAPVPATPPKPPVSTAILSQHLASIRNAEAAVRSAEARLASCSKKKSIDKANALLDDARDKLRQRKAAYQAVVSSR